MSNRRSASRARWITCFTSLFLVGLLACIALGEISLGFNGQAELEYLRNTKTRLTPYTDESIKVLRGHLDRLEAQGFPTPPPPPVGWAFQTTRSGRVASGRVSYHFDRAELPWVQLVNFIDQLEAHFSIQSLDIRSRGSLTHREIARVDITVAVPTETTRRQAATTFPGWRDAALSRQDGPNRHYADRSSSPDHSASRLRLSVRPPFRFVPSLRRSAGQGSFIQTSVSAPSLDIRSRGSLTHREIALVDITVTVPSETTRRQAATTFPGWMDAARRRQDGPNRHYADRATSPDQSASRLRLPVRPSFRFVPSLRRSAGRGSFIPTSFGIPSLDIRSRGSLTHREIALVDIKVAVTSETTRRQAATTFPGSGDAARRRQDGSNRHYADRSSSPDHSAPRLRLPVRPSFRFVPFLRLSAGQGSFIQTSVSPLNFITHDHA